MAFGAEDLRQKLDAPDPFTEDALALRFSAEYAAALRYIATKGQWQSWNGQRWYGEQTYLAFELARRSCREAAQEYGNGNPPKSVLAAKTIAAVERMAKGDRRQATTIEQWDANDWAYNATQATFDLQTAESHAPDPNDYITKLAGCHAARPETPHPLWDAFLERIAPDTEFRAFLKRWCGYCMTGSTREHKFVFAWGKGANGKSTFTKTISGIMGDYATVADIGTFLAAKTERHPTDLAKLHGYRLVVAQETEKGRTWDEVKIKTLTGGDRITARFMRQDFFDFVPTFKLWIHGNHKPRLNNVDEAMRRRMLLLPFTVQIPEPERDLDLADKLKAEWPAILRWMIDGCLEWQEVGLAPPKCVTDATEEYFEDQDLFKQWLEDCTQDGGPFAFTKVSALFSSWKQWCDSRNLQVGSANSLSDALLDRGYIRKKGAKGARGFKAITLKAVTADAEAEPC
jgi:putative DNA primase/helicase